MASAVSIFVDGKSLQNKEEKMNINASATSAFRDTWAMPNSDDIMKYESLVSKKKGTDTVGGGKGACFESGS